MTAARAAAKAGCLLSLSGLILPVVHAAEILTFEFERKGSRYIVRSESYIDVAPAGVFEVLSNYDKLHRISNLVEESKALEPAEEGAQLVYTKNSGCLALFCRTVEKVERLETDPPFRIVAEVIPERSDVSFSRSEWRLSKEGRGSHLSYSIETEISFWVPPVIGNFLLKRWLRTGAENALVRIEYYGWHALYGDQENNDTGPRKDQP